MDKVIVVTEPSPWDTSTVRGLVAICREDRRINGRSPLHPATQAMAVHRLGEWVADPARSCVSRLVGGIVHRAAQAVVRNTIGYEICPGARLGRRVHFAHQHGIIIAPETVIGDDVLIHHDVTIGLRMDAHGKPPAVGAQIGARVSIGAGAGFSVSSPSATMPTSDPTPSS